MKTKLFAILLFLITVTAIVAYPVYQSYASVKLDSIDVSANQNNQSIDHQAKIEVVFVLDTTGSMGGLIKAAKEKIWSIASTMASSASNPEIKMGLVAYRDRGDAYITKVIDLSSDLDSIYATLMDFQANGGGDGPESVNQALYDSIDKISWSQDEQTYRVVFLVGDAPPHMDYSNDVKYPVTLKIAARKGIKVNTIQCGVNNSTTLKWQQIASLGSGRYFQVGQAGSAVAVTTPFDQDLAVLSRKIEKTRLFYGSEEEKAKQESKQHAADKLHAKSSLESRARRAAFNATKSGKKNLLGENELVENVVSGKLDLSKVKTEHLPSPMQSMSLKQKQALIKKNAKSRNELESKIQRLSQERQAYINKKLKAKGGAKDSLDEKIYATLKEQAAEKNIVYEAAAPAY